MKNTLGWQVYNDEQQQQQQQQQYSKTRSSRISRSSSTLWTYMHTSYVLLSLEVVGFDFFAGDRVKASDMAK